MVAGLTVDGAGAGETPPNVKADAGAGEPNENIGVGATPFGPGEAAGVVAADRFPGRPRIGLLASSVGAACLKPSELLVSCTSSSSSCSSTFLSVRYFSAPRFMVVYEQRTSRLDSL